MNGQHVVVDTGPDFRQQMLRVHVPRLDAVVFTHEHRDHIAGLDDIRAYNFIQKRSMDVYAEERVFRSLKSEFPYVFADEKYPGVPQINEHPISIEPFQIREMQVIPVRLKHFRLPVLGFRFEKFAYLTDANFISKEEMEKLNGVKYLVVNALRKESHVSHFTLEQAIDLIAELAPEKGYITHVSHQMGLTRQWEKGLPANIFPAYDGLTLEL